LKLPKESIGKSLENISIGKIFLNRTSIPQEIRTRISKWDCIKLNKLLHCKRENRMKRCTEREKIFASYVWGKGLIPKIHK
jgi:hypothetical protein